MSNLAEERGARWKDSPRVRSPGKTNPGIPKPQKGIPRPASAYKDRRNSVKVVGARGKKRSGAISRIGAKPR